MSEMLREQITQVLYERAVGLEELRVGSSFSQFAADSHVSEAVKEIVSLLSR